MAGLPAAFARAVTGVHGAAGEAWLARLPGLVEECAVRWGLRLGPLAGCSYHYVVYAQRGGEACVLKLGVPGHKELAREAAVLTLVGGDGAVRLLAHDPARGALLLERAEPGDPLAVLVPERDAAATAAAADVLRRLWRQPAPDLGLPHAAALAGGLARYLEAHPGAGPLPRGLVADAAAVFGALAGSGGSPALLHGDLHHHNVLASRRAGWVAIDPKGFLGDPALDCAALLANPHDVLASAGELETLLNRRVHELADLLDLDAARIAGWGFAHAVLSECWFVEDHGRPHGTPRAVAGVLRDLLP